MLPSGSNEQTATKHLQLVKESESKVEKTSSTKSYLLPDSSEINNLGYEILWDSIRNMINTKSNYSKEIEVETMDNNFLEKYIDKLNTDQYELKNDIRESETRISNAIKESESRNEKRMERLEKIVIDSNVELRNEIKGISLDTKEFKESVLNETKEFKKYIDSNNKWLLGIMLTFILSTAAIVLSITTFLAK